MNVTLYAGQSSEIYHNDFENTKACDIFHSEIIYGNTSGYSLSRLTLRTFNSDKS